MKRISRISKIEKIENNLRQQENEKEKTKKEYNEDFDSILKEEEKKLQEKSNTRKKVNTLDAYKFEIQKNSIIHRKINQPKENEEEQLEK